MYATERLDVRGVEEAEGKSIMVVGLPVGAGPPAGGGSAASAPDGMPDIAVIAGGAPQDAE